MLTEDISQFHQETWAEEWRTRTAARSKGAVKDMLAELAELGSRRDIAGRWPDRGRMPMVG